MEATTALSTEPSGNQGVIEHPASLDVDRTISHFARIGTTIGRRGIARFKVCHDKAHLLRR